MRTFLLFMRRVVVAILLLFAQSAKAAIDSNNNTMSDLWENQVNGGYLFSNSNPVHASSADPDKDGWTNADEAVAGTSPFNPNPPTGRVAVSFVRHPAAQGVFIVSWPSLNGKLYQMKVSTDLTTWANFDEPMSGTGLPIEVAFDAGYEDGSLPDSIFVRVQILDADSDGDTLSDAEELALGYNRFLADTDLDGIADNLDILPLVNAVDADPDGLGLPASLETGLIGRWDFESKSFGTGGHPTLSYRYPDSSPFARPASGNVELDAEGMISKATASTATSVVAIPPAMLNTVAQNQSLPKPKYSVSFWVAITPDSITSGAPIGLFGHSTYESSVSSGGQTIIKTQADGVWVQKNDGIGGGYDLYAGTYIYSNQPAATTTNALSVHKAAGELDDGQWHHYLLTREGTVMTLYRDGVSLGSNNQARAMIGVGSHTAISFGRLYGPSPDDNPASLGLTRCLTGRLDRLRIWSRTLTAADALTLYHQDSDRDQLWDITENKTALWRDANSNAIRTANEVSYISSPFRWQPTNSDIDGDEATEIAEQNAGTNVGLADTDRDRIPDGWELAHGLNPKSDADALLDPDGDGLTNVQEWQYNTNPHLANTDGGDPAHPDTINDAAEVAQGSNPNDAADGGQAPASSERLPILLGVGDQSDSHSEDYVIHCFEIDSETGTEKRVYTFRSGGFGEYDEKPVNIFRKDRTYTFQIQWQGSKLTYQPASPGVPSEGPDFDYTFKVQPQNYPAGMLVDSWDAASGMIDVSRKILATGASNVASDAASFKSNYSARRIVLTSLDIDILHPANGILAESLEDGPGRCGIAAVAGSTTCPVTKIRVQKNAWLKRVVSTTTANSPIVSFHFTSGDIYELWAGAYKVLSDTSLLFESGEPFDIKIVGKMVNTSSAYPESVRADLHFGGEVKSVDKVCFNVVKAEYDVFLVDYIPYEWVDILYHPLYAGLVAHGDDRGFTPLSLSYRLREFSRINPFLELSSTGFADGVPQSINAAGMTVHFDAATSLPDPDTLDHQGLQPANRLLAVAKAEAEATGNEGAPYKTNWGHADVSRLSVTRSSGGIGPIYNFKGAASEPIIVAAADIDWDLTVHFDTTDPEIPTASVGGFHDGFPAYEIYAFSAEATYDPARRTDLLDWKPPLSSNVMELLGPATTPVTTPTQNLK